MSDFPKREGYWKISFKDKNNHFDNLEFEIAYLYYDGSWQLYRVGERSPINPGELQIVFLELIASA